MRKQIGRGHSERFKNCEDTNRRALGAVWPRTLARLSYTVTLPKFDGEHVIITLTRESRVALVHLGINAKAEYSVPMTVDRPVSTAFDAFVADLKSRVSFESFSNARKRIRNEKSGKVCVTKRTTSSSTVEATV